MESLDNILSGGREAVPEGNQVEEQVAQVAEGEGQQQQTEVQGAEGEGGQKMVPHEALHAEKQKVKRYTEEVADFRKQLADRDAAWERRMAELVSAVKPKQEQQSPPDQFDDFPGATRHVVQPEFERVNSALLANAQLIAGIKYGDDKVSEAEQAFISAVQSQKLDPADYHKVVGSPNRYAAAVQWHQQQLARQEIGDDPAAFRAKVEAEIREKVLAEVNGGEPPAQRQAQVMPSNLAAARNVGSRNGPAWGGPSDITSIFASKRGR